MNNNTRSGGVEEQETPDFERWTETIRDMRRKGSVNMQQWSDIAPDDEEGFLRLAIYIEDVGVKEFVVTHMLSDVLSRKKRYADYITTDMKGAKKIVISFGWKRREDVWKNTSDKQLESIRKYTDEIPQAAQKDNDGLSHD